VRRTDGGDDAAFERAHGAGVVSLLRCLPGESGRARDDSVSRGQARRQCGRGNRDATGIRLDDGAVRGWRGTALSVYFLQYKRTGVTAKISGDESSQRPG